MPVRSPSFRESQGVYLVGFAVLGFHPTLAVVLVFQVAQRWANYAIANPARQVFFTDVDRGEKYKAKNFIDIVVFRGSGALYGWVFDTLQVLGLKLGVVAVCALPIAAAWLALSTALGRGQERRAEARTPDNGRLTTVDDAEFDPQKFVGPGQR